MKSNPRREFLKNAGLLTAGFTALRLPAWAKYLSPDGYPRHNIPVNKQIDPDWLRSLYQPGSASAYLKSKNELKYIGMPVGGLHAGTVYLGGDGRLWLWQIYNETMEPTHEGIDPKTVNWNDGTKVRKIRSRDGSAYVEPAIADNKRVLDQGFAIRVVHEGETLVRELKEEHWDEVRFEPSYPTARVSYSSKDFPLEVRLHAYSPFVPLDAENSSLPTTILRLELINNTQKTLDVSLLGWMENGASKLTAKAGSGKKRSVAKSDVNLNAISFDFDTTDPELKAASDYGSMCLALHNTDGKVNTSFRPWPVNASSFDEYSSALAELEAPGKLVGSIAVSQKLAAGQSFKADYSIAWHFNNPHPKLKKLVNDANSGYLYATKFQDAFSVSKYLAKNFEKLTSTTELWSQTWNDSSLPRWFLDRTFLNIGTLATANTYRFASGRFWGWEGVGACAGTCTHVWQYAQSVARIFPELERDLRERVDLGVAFRKDDGAIIFRAENESRPAIDGQAGTILRFYREHQMSADNTFLNANWPRIKKAVEFVLAQDKNGDGMTDTPMENTLDAVWEGEIAWIVGLCIAAARAAQAMAEETGDKDFARICHEYVSKGRKNMQASLFNGEYFIHRPDPVQGRKKLGSYNTCHIDQVYGQSWVFQVGLPRVLDKEMTLSALKALWKYNFTLNVGPYIKTHTGGRPYAIEGDGGLVMNTNPLNEPKPYGENVTWQLGYFHECMSGFEHQVAAHMMAEGMVDESLVLTRVIHDRYKAVNRNPFNEIECSDHYARAMASYGTFINACGYEYHGPKGYIAFAPRISPENFKAAFTAAEGWGTFAQNFDTDGQLVSISLKYGQLRLRIISLFNVGKRKLRKISVMLDGERQRASFEQEKDKVTIELKDFVEIKERQSLQIKLT